MNQHELARSNSSSRATAYCRCCIDAAGDFNCAGLCTALCGGKTLFSGHTPRTMSRNGNHGRSQRRKTCCSCQRLRTSGFFRSAGESGRTILAFARRTEQSGAREDSWLARTDRWKFAGQPGPLGHISSSIGIAIFPFVDHNSPQLNFCFKSIHKKNLFARRRAYRPFSVRVEPQPAS